jgi:hypothetical protein
MNECLDVDANGSPDLDEYVEMSDLPYNTLSIGCGFLYNTRATYLGSWRPGQQASRHPSKRRCGIVATQESHKESHDEDESNPARWLFPLLLLLCFFHTQFHTYIHDAALII